jgi:NitT/TauT family transport system ATP-binding protein
MAGEAMTTTTHPTAGSGRTRAAKISVREVRKTFALRNEEFVALERVSLDIADNEFVTVVGPSGCGKSTLMNILAGLGIRRRATPWSTARRSPAPGRSAA